MNLFLDTSFLFKLYHHEADSHLTEDFFKQNDIDLIFLSELAKVEFASTVWKKLRTKELNETQATSLLESFEDDYEKYFFVTIDSATIEQAKQLLSKYGASGLKTLDSIQLSTALFLRNQADFFKSADKRLDGFFKAELLPT